MTKYGKILLLISILDMITTIIGIHFGILKEVQLIWKWHLEKGGFLLFGSAKLLITNLVILVFETILDKQWLSQYSIKKCYFFCVIGYAAVYLVMILAIIFCFVLHFYYSHL